MESIADDIIRRLGCFNYSSIVASESDAPSLNSLAINLFAEFKALVTPFIFSRYIDKRPLSDYGLKKGSSFKMDKISGFVIGPIGIGVIFQGLITVLMIQNGSTELISVFTFSTGLPIHFWLTDFISTVFGFLAVAFWEELIFRGVLIKNASEALNSRLKHRQLSAVAALLLGPVIFGVPHIFAVAECAYPALQFSRPL